MFIKAQTLTFFLFGIVITAAHAQSPVYIDPMTHKSMMSIDLSGDESHQIRAEAIVSEHFSEEGAIKRFSSVVLDMSVVQNTDELDDQANANDESGEVTDLVISPFPGISYLVQQTSFETGSHGVTTWRGKIDGQEYGRVRLTCGWDGRCYGRISSTDGKFVIAPTDQPPFHVVYEIDREKIKNLTGRQPGTTDEDWELRRKVDEWYSD